MTDAAVPKCKIAKLDELGMLARGKSRHRPRNDPSLYGGDYPFVQTGDIRAANLYVVGSEQTYNGIGLAQSKLWPTGTLCITIAANIAETAILGLDACFPDSVVGFVADSRRADTLFIKYYIDVMKLEMQGMSHGTTQDNLSIEKLTSLEFKLPAPATQRRIASILSAYDDLIENNLRRIKVLEEMAQSLYKEWFVDFRFPGHEGVKMVDSPLGMIPEGWETRRVGDLATISRGRSYSSENLVEAGGLPFVNLKCIDRDGGFRRGGLKWFSGPIKEQHVVRRGDIVMAVTDMTQERRIVARAARVPDVGEAGGVMSMDLVKLMPCQVPGSYLYYLLRCSGFPDEVKNHATGVNVLHLNPDRIADFEVPIPSADLMEVFSAIADDALLQQETLETQSGCLQRTRDLLLPRLISGEIDVSDLDIDANQGAA